MDVSYSEVGTFNGRLPFISAHEPSQETWPVPSQRHIWQSRVELNRETWTREQEVKHLNNRIAITLIRSQLALYIHSNGIHCRINPDRSTSKSKWSTWDYIYNRGSKRSCCLKYFITFYLLLFNHVDFFGKCSFLKVYHKNIIFF